MEFLKKYKLVTGVAAAALLVALYFLFFSGSSATPVLSSSDQGTNQASQTLLVTLSNLHTIRLNGAIFSDPVFVSLTDFGVVIPPEAVGRRNPFVPFAASAGKPASIKVPVLPH